MTIVTIAVIVIGVVGLVGYEVGADRKVRRSTAGATPVVVVRGLRPRWWRRLLGKAIGFTVSFVVVLGLGLLVLHLVGTAVPSDVEHRWPMPAATTGAGAAR